MVIAFPPLRGQSDVGAASAIIWTRAGYVEVPILPSSISVLFTHAAASLWPDLGEVEGPDFLGEPAARSKWYGE